MQYDDGTEVDGKGIGRKVLDKVKETYRVELENKEFAYDGEKSLFTVGQLPSKKLEFTVVLNDISSSMYLYAWCVSLLLPICFRILAQWLFSTQVWDKWGIRRQLLPQRESGR